ncbi:MAG: dihydrodipicolinate synthase family protein [Bryobacteraceae bacterium]
MVPLLPKPLGGIIVPVVTPLSESGDLDIEGLQRVVVRLLDGSVHGLFVLGSTGEGPSLPPVVREKVIALACAQAAGRVPVLAGISDTCMAESLRLARLAADRGASALVLAPPHYLAVSQTELYQYARRLAAEVPLPLFLYNAPSFTKVWFEPETVRRLADEPNIVGLKDSGGDWIYLHQVRFLLGDREDFSLLVGPEELLADLLLWGGHGGVSGGAHLWPQLYTGLYHAALDRDLERVKRLHSLLMYVNTQIYCVSPTPCSVFKVIKCALSLMGVCGDIMAPPLQPLLPDERAVLQVRMEEMERMLAENAAWLSLSQAAKGRR